MVIYHTNDIHSDYDVLKRVHCYLKNNRREEDFYFDTGDYLDLKSIVVQSDKGNLAMKLLMACGLDVMAAGNNEMDLTNEYLTAIAEKYPMLSANVTDNEGNGIHGLSGSRILEKNGKRFLLIGLSPYYAYGMIPGKYNVFYTMGNLLTADPFDLVGAELEKNKGQYDYCILLSHSGLAVDEIIKEKYPEIDLFLCGHCHSVLKHENFNQCGKGEYLGKITLDVSDDGVVLVKNELIDLKAELGDNFEDEEFDALLNEVSGKAEAIMSKELPAYGELKFNAFSECEFINFICDCLYKHFGGDFTFMHSGIAEGDLKKPVTRASLIRMLPSKLNPTKYKIKGAKVLEGIRLSLDSDYIHQSGMGPGFRGSVLGTLGFSSNVKIVLNPLKVFINGVELDPDRMYDIVTDDYLQRGTGYECLGGPDEEASYDIWFIRDLVEHYLQDKEMFEKAKVKRLESVKIGNNKIACEINLHGAELKSLVKNGREYMWQAGAEFWARTSPVLFPFVGGVFEKTYRVNGKPFSMGQHGFARDSEFEISEVKDNKCSFILRSTAETKEKYPYDFELVISYVLENDSVKVVWTVKNTGDERLHFSIGAHPAFNCTYNESCLEIKKDGKPLERFDNTVFGAGVVTKEHCSVQAPLQYKEHTFDGDAYVLENNQTDCVCLYDRGEKIIEVSFTAPVCGLWAPVGKPAPFMCIEPWYGRADEEGFTGDISERKWGNTIAPGEVWSREYTITCF